jgi:hypothetical protein
MQAAIAWKYHFHADAHLNLDLLIAKRWGASALSVRPNLRTRIVLNPTCSISAPASKRLQTPGLNRTKSLAKRLYSVDAQFQDSSQDGVHSRHKLADATFMSVSATEDAFPMVER